MTGQPWVARVVGCIALVVAGCTGGGAADEARVEAVSMRVEDLPPEWRPSPPGPPDTSVETEGDNSRFAQCVGRPEPKTVRTATVASPRYRIEDRSWASSAVQTVKTVAIANDDFAALEGNRAVGCLRQRLQAQLDRESTPGNAPERFTVERLPGIAVGDRTVAFRAVIHYRGSTAYLDVINVQKDKVELSASFFNRGEPFPAEFERSVLAKMVDRA